MTYWKKLGLVTLLGLALGTLAGSVILGDPAPARCASCYADWCTNSVVCGPTCLCIKRGMDLSGYCYSIE